MTLGEVALFRKGGPHRELRAEDCQPAIRPAAGRVSPSSLKGNLDSASQCLQHFLTHFSLSAAAIREASLLLLSPHRAEDPSHSSPPLKLPSPNLQMQTHPQTKGLRITPN